MKNLITKIAIGAAIFVAAAVPTFAKTSHTNVGKEVNASACNQSLPPVVNITYSVINDADSGTLGNVWANDNYIKTVQVWPQGNGTFCAVVRYEGQFVTYAGSSPGAAYDTGGTVGAGVQGTLTGGYTATFTGTLADGLQTTGDLGLKDYACGQSYTCPGLYDWLSIYFPNNAGFTDSYWGWNYQTGNNGSWVNAISGNNGDITGN